ncbi:MAG TPA: hypothetical protein ENN81_11495 [Phycisphaerales bacterium]|nr:hypothetical protein [Phycisphaerales bacterium]
MTTKAAVWIIALGTMSLTTIRLCAFGQAGAPAADSNAPDANGPTIVLDYSAGGRMNPTEDFMYFVPLISPTLVRREISEGNTQTGRMVSVTWQRDAGQFTCVCVFKMVGNGTQTYYFDPRQMIDHNLKEHPKGEPLKNILDYIQFHGEGEGRMEARGRLVNDRSIVDQVDVHFVNNKSDVSPVTIRLYSVKSKDGRYDYDNGYNRIIARVETLSFKRTDDTPKMGIKITSLKNEGAKEGLWSRVKATVVNLFIPPLEVDKLGNQTMIDFGRAVYRGEPTFTFPRARNLQEMRRAAGAGSAGAKGR